MYKPIKLVNLKILNDIRKIYIQSSRNLKMSSVKSIELLSENDYFQLIKKVIPKLEKTNRKGNHGRIAVIGGSFEYTGAPYFSAISALKVGCDLIHVFCPTSAASVIKSYSPELIVHPILDLPQADEKISEWLERMHAIVIGPGLGRDQTIFNTIYKLIDKLRQLNKPLILDADALFAITCRPEVIKNYKPLVILTPNQIEFSRMFSENENIHDSLRTKFGENAILIRKGATDVILDCNSKLECTLEGSARRCGGQGDILSGSLGTFITWSLNSNIEFDINKKGMIGCYAASLLTRECNKQAFRDFGRSMTCSDMIEKIFKSFQVLFESDGSLDQVKI